MNCGIKIEKIATLALFLLSLAVLAGFVPFGAGRFRGVAESALRGMGADSVSVGGVSVVLWTGLQANEASVYKRIDKGDGYRVRASHAEVSCNLIGAALALAAAPGIFKPGRDVFREVYERPFELAGEAFGAAVSLRPVKKIVLRGAGASFFSKGKPGVSVSGADVVLGRIGGSAFSGSVTVKEAVVPALAKAERFSANIFVDDKSVEVTNGGGTVFGGKFRTRLAVDARQSKILSGELSVNGLDLGKFCAGTGFSPGRLAGKVDLDARLDGGSPVRLDSVKARGSVTVRNLTAADLALQTAPVVSRLSRDLRLLRFSEVKGGFVLAGGLFRFKEIAGAGDVLKFRSSGWVGFDGKLSQDFEGEFGGEFVAGLPKLLRNSFETTESGGGRFKCKISGAFHNPRIDVDNSVYDRAIGGFFKNMFK